MSKFVIPRRTVYRLSLYFRIVERLVQNRIDTVSSAALAKAAGVKPTQLRKDLTYFGQLGRGVSVTRSRRLSDNLQASFARHAFNPSFLSVPVI